MEDSCMPVHAIQTHPGEAPMRIHHLNCISTCPFAGRLMNARTGSLVSAFFLGLVSPAFREETTAIRQIERLGSDPRDVRHIVLAVGHAGGLDDFLHASVLMLHRQRCRPQRCWFAGVPARQIQSYVGTA